MIKLDEQRVVILEPLFTLAQEHASGDLRPFEDISARLAYCLKLLAGNNPLPATPREMAHILLDMARKLGSFHTVTDQVLPWEIETWEALELLAKALIKVDGERGIRCLELATLYQIRYWTRSPARFRGSSEEKSHYVQTLSVLLQKLELQHLTFYQFDNWNFSTGT